ncbi:hypothetical protein [Microbacterium trichothecenolyticum]|uniref:Uncharacterized protein n=1 Tax=Microbacterium trichothecenolyticum TaxID=69370 RepID=A0ABU0TR74_MICTR|nr:hypothetical protein [Microbacterium trichothecenolyticum]MDQ1122167.1 hypothetical protein [Microbacterium trichothecenolyticum]
MKTITIPNLDPFDQETAEEYIHRAMDPNTGVFAGIYVDRLDDPSLDRGTARAIAVRLLSLADAWDREDAERENPEYVANMVTLDKGEPGCPDPIVLMDARNMVTHSMSTTSARSVARALTNLADQVDAAKGVVLRRLPSVDDELRERDV